MFCFSVVGVLPPGQQIVETIVEPREKADGARRVHRRRPPADPPELLDALRQAETAALALRDGLARELGRAGRIRLADRFRSVLIPRRRAGRKSKAAVTTAYQDWKAGVQGVELYRRHIRNWSKLTQWRRRSEQRTLMTALYTRQRREQTLW